MLHTDKCLPPQPKDIMSSYAFPECMIMITHVCIYLNITKQTKQTIYMYVYIINQNSIIKKIISPLYRTNLFMLIGFCFCIQLFVLATFLNVSNNNLND